MGAAGHGLTRHFEGPGAVADDLTAIKNALVNCLSVFS
jgi:hypothetical protein